MKYNNNTSTILLYSPKIIFLLNCQLQCLDIPIFGIHELHTRYILYNICRMFTDFEDRNAIIKIPTTYVPSKAVSKLLQLPSIA